MSLSRLMILSLIISCFKRILGHRYKFAPSEIHASIADDIGTGGNIVDHPDVMDIFRDIEELGPGVMLMGGNLIYNPKV